MITLKQIKNKLENNDNGVIFLKSIKTTQKKGIKQNINIAIINNKLTIATIEYSEAQYYAILTDEIKYIVDIMNFNFLNDSDKKAIIKTLKNKKLIVNDNLKIEDILKDLYLIEITEIKNIKTQQQN